MSSGKTRGVVAAGDPQTANAGAELLRAGGNAVDAALAAAFAAFVCELPLCSPLGGGVMLLELPGLEPEALDLFARGPGLGGGARPEMDFEDVTVSFGAASQVFHIGRGSAAVPLALPGLLEAHRRWGRLPLEAVVEPAAELGKRGYVLGPGVAFVFQLLTPIVERTLPCRALFAGANGEIARAGARLANPDLGRVLESIARTPETLREVFAELASEFGPKQGGLITATDLERARVVDARPVRVAHGGWELFTMPGPSTGGVLVALGLRLLEGIGATRFMSPEHVLGMAEVQRALLGERDEHFDERCRDPRTIRELLDEARIGALRSRLGSWRGLRPAAPDSPLGSTTHISVIDEHGGAVSLTLTNGEGCGHVLAGTGMVMNNLLGEEDIHPHGFHRDPPGRPLSTMMAPTVLRRGGDRIVLGSGGSNRLRNAILSVIVGLIEHGVDVERAVSAPRLQLEVGKDSIPRLAFETAGLEPASRSALSAAYPEDPRVFDALNLYFGGVHVALGRGGGVEGAGDPRRGGAASIVD